MSNSQAVETLLTQSVCVWNCFSIYDGAKLMLPDFFLQECPKQWRFIFMEIH